MADLYTFTADQHRRFLAMLRRFEEWERAGKAGEARRQRPEYGQVLKIVGSVSSGLYPAKVSYWDDGAGAETLSDEVRWKPRDGATPAAGDYVWGKFSGQTADGQYGVYQGVAGGGGGYTGTQTVVTDVTWNTSTCVMTKTTKTFTWENGRLVSVV